jgi:hypothetical protein
MEHVLVYLILTGLSFWVLTETEIKKQKLEDLNR